MADSIIPIPPDRLSPEVLTRLIEEYVSRDGTNLADTATMVKHVRKQLERGDVIIIFDVDNDNTNIVAKDGAR
jgi:uncharacterized protein